MVLLYDYSHPAASHSPIGCPVVFTSQDSLPTQEVAAIPMLLLSAAKEHMMRPLSHFVPAVLHSLIGCPFMAAFHDRQDTR